MQALHWHCRGRRQLWDIIVCRHTQNSLRVMSVYDILNWATSSCDVSRVRLTQNITSTNLFVVGFFTDYDVELWRVAGACVKVTISLRKTLKPASEAMPMKSLHTPDSIRAERNRSTMGYCPFARYIARLFVLIHLNISRRAAFGYEAFCRVAVCGTSRMS